MALLSNGFSTGRKCLPGRIWQCPEICWVATTGRGVMRHLEGEGHGGRHFATRWTAPPARVLKAKMSIVSRLGNPALKPNRLGLKLQFCLYLAVQFSKPMTSLNLGFHTCKNSLLDRALQGSKKYHALLPPPNLERMFWAIFMRSTKRMWHLVITNGVFQP